MPKEWLSEIIHLFRHVKEERPSISNFRMSNVEGFDVSAVNINNGCGPIECTSTPILELGEGSLAMLIVGCVHGDEISGPPVVYHLVKLLVGLLEDEIGKELLKSRRIVLLPFANVWGYMNQKRHDLTGSDPNRDFPYHEENCLKTITANQVSQALVPDDISMVLTFHGGQRSMSYGWGTFAHGKKGGTLASPDEIAYETIAFEANKASGSEKGWYSLVGRTGDVVYPVDGGMEDWAYAAAWECQFYDTLDMCPVNRICNNGRIPSSPKSLVFLLETDDDKRPSDEVNGDPDISSDLLFGSHMKLSIRSLELNGIGQPIEVLPGVVRVYFCHHLTSMRIVWTGENNVDIAAESRTLFDNTTGEIDSCVQLEMEEESSLRNNISLSLNCWGLYMDGTAGVNLNKCPKGHYSLSTKTDEDWSTRSNEPSPDVEPQGLLVQNIASQKWNTIYLDIEGPFDSSGLQGLPAYHRHSLMIPNWNFSEPFSNMPMLIQSFAVIASLWLIFLMLRRVFR